MEQGPAPAPAWPRRSHMSTQNNEHTVQKAEAIELYVTSQLQHYS